MALEAVLCTGRKLAERGYRACGWVVILILMRRCGGAAAKSCGRARAQCIDRFCDYDLVTNNLL
jgi:hypothetical protein